MVKKILSQLLAASCRFINLVIGKVSWNTPPWINYLRNKAAVRPNLFWGASLGILFFIAALAYGYQWYQSLPQPERVIAEINPPKITPVDKVLIPDTLNIDFGVSSGGALHSRPVAPLDRVGKEVTQGISMAPTIAGKWTWDSDSHLIFTPAIDWPAGQTYTIEFKKDFFTFGTRMESLSYSFSTLPFEAAITEFKFYQDPIKPELRQAVATVNFSYPVDTNSLTNKVSLVFQELKKGEQHLNAQRFKYTLDYDEHKRTAYIHSESLSLPAVERYLTLTLAKGIKPIAGPSVTPDDIKAKVLIPDVGSYFKVSHAAATIVRNQQDRPLQVLTLETTLGVTEAELNKSLHVYLLPQDYPVTAVNEAKTNNRNYQWQDPGEVTPAILALSKPLKLQAIPADRDYASLHSYQFNAKTPAFIYLKLEKGTHGFGNFVQAFDYAAIIKVPEYPKEISFLHKGALLALGTEEKLSVLVRGLSAVKFSIARVLPDDVNHLVSQTSGDFSNPYFIGSSFNQDNISEIFSQIQQFDATDPAKEQYTALDLSQYLAAQPTNGGPLGLFLLQAHGWNSVKNTPLNVQTNRLVLMTDLGLIVKDNNDGTHDVFVQSITNGTPINAASVAVLGKNGIPILTQMTDVTGHASFPTLKDFTNQREPTVYVVRNGNDVSFIPYNHSDRQLNYSRFDVGGITMKDPNQAALTAYLFSDRGIYRPGDTAHIGMIIKQPYVMPQSAGLPLEATVIDPRGVTVKDEKITLNDTGYLTLDFQTNATSPTGQYLINLYIVKDNHPSSLIGSVMINVAEFLPDRMRITAHLSQEQQQGWISPAGLTVKLGLWNLYGAPAANHRISGKILLTPQTVTFKAFPDYTFIDPMFDPKAPPKVFSDTLTDTRTNEQGQAEFDLKLDRFEKATYQLTVFVEGFEAEGGRSVTTQTTALVSPLTYLVGYKPDGDLTYIKQNGARNVHLIAINPALKQQALPNLRLQLFSQHPVSTLIKKEDGTYQYQSIIQTSQISNNSFAITDQGVDYSLPTQTIGNFLVAIVDQTGTELSRFNYSVIGNSQQPLPKNAELNVKLNQSEFAPGDDIEMQITAPYTGAGLITIERDKVHAYQWFKTSTTASVQKIHIPNDFQGGGYVNIAFVRDLNSPEIFMSPLSYSVVPFAVTHKNREIQVDLSTPELARPGDAFPITYKTDKPGKIIVFAVDEGILEVSKYKTPNPIKFFFEKHALLVNTMQIVDQILPKFIAERELSAVGGDNGEAQLSKNLNPFKRKTELPVVYWSGIVDTDATPRQLVYQLPDYYNGTLRVMAVAVAADAVGATEKSAQVRGYFVINPNVPTFVAPGDEFEVTASIANNVEGSGANAAISVELTATPELDILNGVKQPIMIPEGQERSVRVKVRAKPILGSAELKLTATLNDKSSTLSSTLSVRPATPYFTSITSGYTTDGSKALTLDRILYPEYRTVEAAVSPSPLILVAGLQRYLNEYPFGCTEQLVSKAFPLLAMANQPWFATDTKAITDKIQQTIQMLGQRQLSNGGFNYWPETGTNYSYDFASVYAVHFLTEAKAQGYSVPGDVFSAAIGYLKDLAGQEVKDLDQARIQAYAIYILTRNEFVTTNYLTNLQLTLDQHPDYHWHNDITSVYIAATYQLLKSASDAERIIHYYNYKPQSKSAPTPSDFYNQNIANAQYLYLIARHFPDQLLKLDNGLVMSLVNSLNSDTISTILSSYTSLALAAYGQYYPLSNDVQLSISDILTDGKQRALSSSNGLYQKVSVDPLARQIAFTNPSKQGYFYQIVQAGFNKDLPKKTIQQGIEVHREYRNADDTVLHTTHLGDEIVVHIRARATDNQYHDNVALVDLTPGGFEVVRDSVTLQNMDYIDRREDRVIFFGSITPDSKEMTYRIKATNIGKFTVPPMFAMSMYNPLIESVGLADTMNIEDAK
jgi:alpha-2-macroglobulin